MVGTYYDEQAEAFFARTKDADLSDLHRRFLAHIPPAGRLLDAGCGSGRDALAFARAGYEVTAFDASPALVRLARKHTGLDVLELRFEDVAWTNRFEGIWACASLLHVTRSELPRTLERLADALRPGGVIYMSFKAGDGEREQDGRRFTDLTQEGLTELMRAVPCLTAIEIWCTTSILARKDENWVNGLARREP